MSLKKLNQSQMPVAKAALAPNIPQELTVDILLRLPAKSIGKFRCVSKPWRCLLSDPLFITAHLTLHLCYPQKLIFFSSSPVPLSSRSIYTLTFTTADNPGSEAVLQKLTLAENILENTSSKYASIVGSCNGLVLVLGFRMEIGFRDTMYLINPTTMEFVKLPASPLVREAVRIGGVLGYDSSNDDYKIVTVSCDEPTSNETSS